MAKTCKHKDNEGNKCPNEVMNGRRECRECHLYIKRQSNKYGRENVDISKRFEGVKSSSPSTYHIPLIPNLNRQKYI